MKIRFPGCPPGVAEEKGSGGPDDALQAQPPYLQTRDPKPL